MPEELETVHRYKCRICGAIFISKDKEGAVAKALKCEETVVEKAICKVGHAVKVYGAGYGEHGTPVIIDEISIEKVSHKLLYDYFDGHRTYSVYKNVIHINR